MADIDDNPEDLTLAEAISYLAFDCLLAKEGLAARRVEKDEPRSEDESAKLHEMATNEERNAIAARRSPDGLKLLADNWTGQDVQVFPTQVEFKGETVDAIRVRVVQEVQPTAAPRPAATATISAPMADVELNDEIPW